MWLSIFFIYGCANIANTTKEPVYSAEELYDHASKSVVIILSEIATPPRQGSGVIIAPEEVITNAHVVSNIDDIKVYYQGFEYQAEKKYVDEYHDLCQLHVAGLKAPPAILRSSKNLRVGEDVFAIGAPRLLIVIKSLKSRGGYPAQEDKDRNYQLAFSKGIISSLHPADGSSKIIQNTASGAQGSSGGGLFDNRGKLVGITSFVDYYPIEGAYRISDTNLFFANPTDWITNLPDLSRTTIVHVDIDYNNLFQRNYDEWLNKAIELKENENWQELVNLSEKWMKAFPDNVTVYTYLTTAYINTNNINKALGVAQKATENFSGNAEVWNTLAYAYSNSKMYAKAEECLNKAIEIEIKNGPRTDYNLYVSELIRYRISDNIKIIKTKAFNGDSEAQINLGIMHYYGLLGKRDDIEALKWFLKAANQGSAKAQLYVGKAFCSGSGASTDHVECVKWIRKAATQGYAAAQHILGVIYFDGRAVTKDYLLAYKWVDLSLQQGEWRDEFTNQSSADAKSLITRISKQLTSSQIEEAKHLTTIE